MRDDLNNPGSTGAETEPTASSTTTPMWLVSLLFMVFFVAAWSFDRRGGWFKKNLYGPYLSTAALDSYQPPPALQDPLYAKGKTLYAACAACHMVNGVGSASVGAPPLVESEWVLAEGPNRLIRIVLDGLTGPISVKGQQYGSGVMTGFRPAFSDEDVAAILTYVRQSREFGHHKLNVASVTAAEVKAVREATKDRGSNWTEPELLQVPVK